MNGQLAIVLLIVGVAVLYLGRQTWRTWSGKGKGCGKGCCDSHPNPSETALIPSDQLTLRTRDARGFDGPMS